MNTAATIHRYSTPFLKQRIFAISNIALAHYKGELTVNLKRGNIIESVEQNVNNQYRSLSQKHHPILWRRLQKRVNLILEAEVE